MIGHSAPVVVHVISGLAVGGAERALYNLLSRWASPETAHVVTLSGRGYYGDKLEALGVTVHDLPLRQLTRAVRPALRLRGQLAQIRPAIVQGWMYHGNAAGAALARVLPGRPRLAFNIRHSIYDLGYEKPMTRQVIRLGAALSRRADAVIYNSAVARGQHVALGYADDAGQVIPNGIDTDRWRPDPAARARIRAELGIDESSRVIGFVGRNHPMKDIPNLLAALAPRMSADPFLHCMLVGRGIGPNDPTLRAGLAALPAARVHLRGERDDVPAEMSAFDLFCLSSRSGEGFPNVLGEAMSVALPCITTDCGDAGYVLGDAGFLVPRSDTEALTAAIAEALALPVDRRIELGRRARARIVEKFGILMNLAAYTELYDNLVGGS